MRIGHIVPVLAKRYLNDNTRRRAVFLKGKSGIGKSECVHQASALLGEHIENWQGVIDLRLSQMDPTDMRGVPSVENGRTAWNVPDFFPAPGTSGIMFLDELTSAPAALQAAAYQLILDRAIGSYKLPDGWMIVAAGNLTSDRGVTFQIAAPLLNRMCEMQVDSVLDDFLMHAITIGVKPEILSFLKDRPEFLHKFDGKGVIDPFPTPRAWVAVSNSMDLELAPKDRVEMFRGDIGHEAATTFEVHLRLFESMPRLDDILAGKKVKMPEDMTLQYCVAMGIASRVDAKNFDNAWVTLKDMKKELQTLTVKMAFKRDKSISSSKAFVDFATANADAFRRT